MNSKSQQLLHLAHQRKEELARQEVLSQHWEHLALVLKGSTSRGNADRYSDIDLVFFCPEERKQTIIDAYRNAGLSDRQDGLFFFFAEGHYHLETFTQLRHYFEAHDFVHCWDFQHAIVLSDPQNRFAPLVTEGLHHLFADRLAIVKRAYLDLELDLDWMRMPIVRGDHLATFLHAAKILQSVCRAAYLLDGKCYPPDKWIGRFLRTTRLGRANADRIESYRLLCQQNTPLPKHQPFEQHPLYQQADDLRRQLAKLIRRDYGNQMWLTRWFDYV